MNSSGIGKNTYLPTCLSCSCKLELLQFHLCSLLIAKFYFATRKRMRLLFAQVKMQVKYKKHFLLNEPLANVGSWFCQSCTHHCEPPTIFVCFRKGLKPKLVACDMFSFKTIIQIESCIRGGQCVTLMIVGLGRVNVPKLTLARKETFCESILVTYIAKEVTLLKTLVFTLNTMQ